MSEHKSMELNLQNNSRGIWLVKVPKFLQKEWSQCSQGTEVGRLSISRCPKKRSAVIAFSMNEDLDGVKKMPRKHKFIQHEIKQCLGVFSEAEDSTPGIEPGSSKVNLEGKIIQKFECQPVMDADYVRLKQEVRKAAAIPQRTSIAIDRPINVFKPISHHKHVVADTERQANGVKNFRADRDKVLDMLFAAFEKHQYYNIKDLQKITKQPITFLKEILTEVCSYNMKAPHRNTWELKPEYRHYR
ncbi:Transcription initiation factor IIF beta subunit [Trinorchestia longiramus]|nr:Transcription initiation factor IIF beta subunit [Trinorchestia longiramus]